MKGVGRRHHSFSGVSANRALDFLERVIRRRGMWACDAHVPLAIVRAQSGVSLVLRRSLASCTFMDVLTVYACAT